MRRVAGADRVVVFATGVIALGVAAVAAVAADVVATGLQIPRHPAAAAITWVVFASLELRPIRWLRRLGEQRAASSTLVFTAALCLLLPGFLAVPVTAVTSAAADLSNGRPPLKAGFNAASASLAAGTSVLLLRAGGAQDVGAITTAGQVLALVAALVALHVVNALLVTTVVALAAGERVVAALPQGLRYGAYPDGALLGLSPAMAIAADQHVLLLLPPALLAVAVHHAAQRLAVGEHEIGTDALTGLANRRRIGDELAGVLERHGGGPPPIVLVIDLDGFKAVNDAHGHEVGDRLLVAVGEALRAAVPTPSLVGRVGGDEFVVLLERSSAEEALQLARAVRGRLEAAACEVVADAAVTASVGLAVHRPGGTAEALLRAADLAMYEAKRRGLGVQSASQDLGGVDLRVVARALDADRPGPARRQTPNHRREGPRGR